MKELMFLIQPDWYYVGFWRVAFPGLGMDYFAVAYKESNFDDPNLVYKGAFRFLYAGREEWFVVEGEPDEDETKVCQTFEDACAKMRNEAGGGDLKILLVRAVGTEAWEILKEQNWVAEIEPFTIVQPEEPDLSKLEEIARRAAEKLQ